MTTQYDEKGKIFTQVVAKRRVQVTIQTSQNIIRGTVYVRPDARVKDELNAIADHERFLAVTDAVLFSLQDDELFHTNFMVLNVNHIIWITPEEEVIH